MSSVGLGWTGSIQYPNKNFGFWINSKTKWTIMKIVQLGLMDFGRPMDILDLSMSKIKTKKNEAFNIQMFA